MELMNEAYNFLVDIINNSSVYGPIFASFLIFIESIIPILPLFVFITIVFVAYGSFFGFIISYILTVLGCYLAFFLWRYFFKNFFVKHFRKNARFDKMMKKIDKLDFSLLVIIVALPFSPAFLINITSALSNMKFKKFAIAIIIGKLSIVFFWGFIGTSLLESLKNPKIFCFIILLLGVTYVISKILIKKVKIE